MHNLKKDIDNRLNLDGSFCSLIVMIGELKFSKKTRKIKRENESVRF